MNWCGALLHFVESKLQTIFLLGRYNFHLPCLSCDAWIDPSCWLPLSMHSWTLAFGVWRLNKLTHISSLLLIEQCDVVPYINLSTLSITDNQCSQILTPSIKIWKSSQSMNICLRTCWAEFGAACSEVAHNRFSRSRMILISISAVGLWALRIWEAY